MKKIILIRNSLIIIITGLFIYFYFILPSQKKGFIDVTKNEANQSLKKDNSKSGINETKFLNAEYLSSDEKGNIYTTRAEEAVLNNDNKDNILLKRVYSFTKMKDGTLLEIHSDTGVYDKKTKNVIYKGHVIITNKTSKITCDYAFYDTKKNMVELKNNVVGYSVDNEKKMKNRIESDMASLDVNSKNLSLQMFSKDQKVYGRNEKN